MVTLVPLGPSLISDTDPTWTPAIKTVARVFNPPMFFATRYKLYVGRNSEAPLLNCSSSAARSTSPINTNRPTLHSSRFLSILERVFLRVRNTLDELAHNRVLRIENLVRCPHR